LVITETLIRQQICEVGKLLYNKGMIAGSEGNISCRLPDGDILITPSGFCKGVLEPEQMVRISIAGEVLHGEEKPSSEYRLHLFGYQKRDDLRAAVHAHAPYSSAFALAGIPLEQVDLPEFAPVFGEIPLISYAEPGTQEVAESISPWIDMCHTFLLAKHGIIAFGKDLWEAYYRVETAEHCARILWLSRML
jgi:L-fuculose-phosphate aldolase